MTNTNGFSDSQESALFEEEVYDVIEKEIGITTLPLLTEDIIDEEPEKKFDVNLLHQYPSQSKRQREENQNLYYPLEAPVPIKEEFPGCFNFQLLLTDQGASKHWVYSETLDKVFINMEQTLPIRFKWDPPQDGLYLRTAMVFSLDQYRSDPVQRCHNHMAPTNHSNQGINPRIIKHVVRYINAYNIYDERDGHLSILTPLQPPEAGSQYVPMYLQFFCKNSCPSGMNRRPTELIFTLEDDTNKVLGRRRLFVRVCSCPKRDKEKEESENTLPGKKKRKISNLTGKKMLPSCDTHVFNLQLSIVGKENYLSVLKYAFDVMAGQAARTGQYEFFKPYMDDILRKAP